MQLAELTSKWSHPAGGRHRGASRPSTDPQLKDPGGSTGRMPGIARRRRSVLFQERSEDRRPRPFKVSASSASLESHLGCLGPGVHDRQRRGSAVRGPCMVHAPGRRVSLQVIRCVGDALKTADHGPNHDPWVRIPRPPHSDHACELRLCRWPHRAIADPGLGGWRLGRPLGACPSRPRGPRMSCPPLA